MKPFILGAITAYSFAAIVLVSSAKLGVLPVQADVAPSRLEARALNSALHAAVARHAPDVVNPLPASDENLISGAQLYRQMCSNCHGLSKESDNSFGRSFFPPAPLLALNRTSYTDNEMFWIVKHGIRNTAMPCYEGARQGQSPVLKEDTAASKRMDTNVLSVAILLLQRSPYSFPKQPSPEPMRAALGMVRTQVTFVESD